MLAAMHAADLAPAHDLDLLADGKLHRYRTIYDKPGSKNAWYVLYPGQPAAGAFGSWRTGESHTWQAAATRIDNPAQLAAQRQQREHLNKLRLAEQAQVQASARQRAARLWQQAHPASANHPYLQRKGIQAHGVRQLQQRLVVPARDAQGLLHTLQFIAPDGNKRFLAGGRTTGGYFAIGQPMRRLLLAEGLATGCSLHAATGDAVAVAFHCGNLLPVARALRLNFPSLRLVLCADDDRHTPGNPGLHHARAAAQAVGGWLAWPQFAGGET